METRGHSIRTVPEEQFTKKIRHVKIIKILIINAAYLIILTILQRRLAQKAKQDKNKIKRLRIMKLVDDYCKELFNGNTKIKDKRDSVADNNIQRPTMEQENYQLVKYRREEIQRIIFNVVKRYKIIQIRGHSVRTAQDTINISQTKK